MSIKTGFKICLGLAFPMIATLAGCGQSKPKTVSVSGTVVVNQGEISKLAGHVVEVSLANNPTVRATGVIRPDGQFQLQTYADGVVVPGVTEGDYLARFVIVNEGDGQTAKPKIAPKYLQFQSSGWAFHVPTQADVRLTVDVK